MKNGQCPMCKSNEIYMNDTHHLFLDLHVNFSQKELDPLGSVQGSLAAYVCKNCGYTAFYVKDVAHNFDNFPEKRGWKKVA